MTSKEYTITVYKQTEEEENEEEALEDRSVDEEIEEKKKGMTAGQIVFVIIISAAVLGIVYLVIRKYREKGKQ